MELMIIFLLMLIIPIYASIKVNLSYKKYVKIDNEKKLTGFDVARRILDENNLGEIYVVETKGTMSDHYDPGRKTVRLSTDVYHGTSISSLAIAAHECGHAIQYKEGYVPIKIRNMLVPFVNFGSSLGYYVIIASLVFSSFKHLFIVGLIMVSLALIFQLVTLPVEFDASRRANKILLEMGIVSEGEHDGTKAMLKAAAFTYVAGLVSAIASTIFQILRLIYIFGGRDND